MDLPMLPETVTFRVRDERSGEELGFVFRPLSPADRARVLNDRTADDSIAILEDAVKIALVGVEGLTIEGRPFEAGNEDHLRTLWGLKAAMMSEVAGEILSLAHLNGVQAGN